MGEYIKILKNLLIFISKCIELNSESKPKLIWVLDLDLGVIQDPDPLFGSWLTPRPKL